MRLNELPAEKTRRLCLSLMGASGALLISLVNVAGSARIGGNLELVKHLSSPTYSLSLAFLFGLIGLIFVEFSDHPAVPKEGHPHSKSNYLQSAFVLLFPLGFLSFLFGGFQALRAIFG